MDFGRQMAVSGVTALFILKVEEILLPWKRRQQVPSKQWHTPNQTTWL